ncbi:MAG TPA: TonB-dependent receptor [Gemmatimonadaceae bacterium]|nr:TonB-dependent receptor [Gemmatimonadaceae bacterium]
MWRRSHSRTPRFTLGALAAVVALALTSAPAFTQGSITGRIRAADTRAPLAGAIVSIAGSSDVVQTDDEGRFTLAPVGDGVHSILVRRIGYAPATIRQVFVTGESPIAVTADLEPAPFSLDSVVVRSGNSLGASPAQLSPTPPRAVISREEIEAAPQLASDAFRALARVPGVSSSDLSAGFRVRGAPNREVLLLFDGLELYEPFHLRDFDGALSIVDPTVLGSVALQTGGFGARYGGHLAGVLELSSRDDAPGGNNTVLAASIGGLSGMHRASFAGGRGDVVASARRGMLGTALSLTGDDRGLSPHYYDAYSRLRFRPSDGQEISLSALHASDDLRFDADDMATLQSDNTSSYAWINWRSELSPRVSRRAVLSYARLYWKRDGWNDGGAQPELDVSDRRTFHAIALREDWSIDVARWLHLDAGTELQRLDASYDYTRLQVRPRVLAARWVSESNDADASLAPVSHALGAYLSQRIRPFGALTVETGVRYDRRSETRVGTIDPRASLALALNEGTTLRASWGRYSQPQELYEMQVQDGVSDIAPPERAEERSLSIERNDGPLSFSVAAYDRRRLRINPRFINLESSIDVFPEASLDRVQIAPVSGDARGIEAAASSVIGSLRWSASYALAFNNDVVDGHRVPSAFEQRHTLHLDLDWQPSESWRVSAAWQLHSGWPVTPIAFEVDSLHDGTHHVRAQYGAINSGRLALYHRLDLRVSNERALGVGRLSLYLDLFNAYDRDNPRGLGYTVSDWNAARADVRKRPMSQLPLLPTVGARWAF